MHGGFYPGMNNAKPPFELPVIYEDDHFAVGECPSFEAMRLRNKIGVSHYFFLILLSLKQSTSLVSIPLKQRFEVIKTILFV